MKFLARTWLAAAVTLVLVATVAAAPRPEVSIEHVAPVDREVDGGRTTQAICFCAAYFNEGCTRPETWVCDNPGACQEACCSSVAANGIDSGDADNMFGMSC